MQGMIDKFGMVHRVNFDSRRSKIEKEPLALKWHPYAFRNVCLEGIKKGRKSDVSLRTIVISQKIQPKTL